jgi:hypothetical protein
MTDDDFDSALLAAAFNDIATKGWSGFNVASAAQAAGLDLAQTRARFASRGAVLCTLGKRADQQSLAELPQGTPREKLFDLLMRRFDAFQPYRDGIVALLHGLPTDPAAALLLAKATGDSMGWMLAAAGEDVSGLTGHLRVQGLVAVWLYALRAWEADTSADLASTMAALDRALAQAEKYAGWLEKLPPLPTPNTPKPEATETAPE